MMRTVALAGLVVLGGCAVAQDMQDTAQYRKSVAEYRACVAANPANPATACEAQRLIMQADAAAADRGVLHRGDNATVTIRQQ